jgi:3',5'-cyclic AMP phosphodiesterase CpdA
MTWPLDYAQAIAYGFLTLVWASVSLAVLALAIGWWTPGARAASAVLAALDDRLRRELFRPWVAALVVLPGLVVLMTGVSSPNAHLIPPAGSAARYWGGFWAVTIFYWWIGFGGSKTSGAVVLERGLPEDEPRRRFLILHAIQGALLLFVVCVIAAKFAGPLGTIGIPLAILAAIWRGFDGLRVIAFLRRFHAPQASDVSEVRAPGAAFLLQLSDIHVTALGEPQLDGKPSGNARLEALALGLEPAVPTYLLVSGDAIDRGEPDEWNVALPLLERLRENGSRVLLAPGNHDLATAYTPERAYSFLRPTRGFRAVADASRVVGYLEAAVRLEPELATADGRPLATLVSEELSPLREFNVAWQKAATAAGKVLRDSPEVANWIRARSQKVGPRSLALLQRIVPVQAARLTEPLVEQLVALFPSPAFRVDAVARKEWTRILSASYPGALAGWMIARRFGHLWHDPFPLRLEDPAASVEFLIANSTWPESGLLGSAFGEMDTGQLARLEDRIDASPARIIVLLIHHSFFRWTDEQQDRDIRGRVNIARWALLAYNSIQSREIVVMLHAALARNPHRQIVLCCGHRHEKSRAGPVEGQERLIAMESAALPEAGREGLLWAELGSDGTLRPFRVPLTGQGSLGASGAF